MQTLTINIPQVDKTAAVTNLLTAASSYEMRLTTNGGTPAEVVSFYKPIGVEYVRTTAPVYFAIAAGISVQQVDVWAIGLDGQTVEVIDYPLAEAIEFTDAGTFSVTLLTAALL